MSDSPSSGPREIPAGPPEVTRGLPSVSEARAQRRRLQSLPPRIWLWAVVFIGAGIVIWWRTEQAQTNEMRAELLARQRAVKAELGPRWLPLRDKLERWTSDCGEAAFTDQLPPEDLIETWDFRNMPGIYLRLAQADANVPEKIREASNKSLKDAFTACLLTAENESPLKGPECKTTQECPQGQTCNEFERCSVPSQPYNLRTAYKSLFVLSDEWVAQTQEVTNELTMRGVLGTFDSISDYDLPIAADLLTRSKYFLVVVDEAVSANPDRADAALPVVEQDQDDRSIPTADHPARVCLYRLEDDKLMFKVKRMAAGDLRGPAMNNPESQIFLKRQANSCALALEVKQVLGAETTESEQAPSEKGDPGGAPEGASPAPSTTATAGPAPSASERP